MRKRATKGKAGSAARSLSDSGPQPTARALRGARLELRLTPAELDAFAGAATREGLGTSTWARRTLRIAAGLFVAGLALGCSASRRTVVDAGADVVSGTCGEPVSHYLQDEATRYEHPLCLSLWSSVPCGSFEGMAWGADLDAWCRERGLGAAALAAADCWVCR